MEIFLNILFLVVGMVLLIKGADFFVTGACSVAKRLKVSSLVIGLTIVAIGTSLPELAVSITSAIDGNMDLSVGNVVGSNILNVFLILGIVPLIAPIKMSKSSKKLNFPFLIIITTILLLFCADQIINGATGNFVSRSESIVLLLLFALYIIVLVLNAKRGRSKYLEMQVDKEKYKAELENSDYAMDKPSEYEKNLKIWQVVLYIVLGIAAVAFGGECVSSTAKFLALKVGMSEALVGLTIVALGTSLPELVTSVVAARKGEKGLAIGNIIGSNICNIGLILGSVGTISQIPVSFVILTDLLILAVYTAVFSVICLTQKQLGKKEAIIFLCMYVAYLTFAIVRNYCF